ncbi:hypothetical protein PF005_g173 [Phytophthora fragariae]|uniref:Uncharacterized protein n=1 Tax=Phytophthora fragariae TaxID=53985 RepID=A0A6A4ALW5_9STRA|nr:hypothetical protein PF003_g20141 [Phytophthora fragariae]KAE8950321.1 hypothetical protein PF009_g172 [Phytophthora fragariae]KAE9030462.1 hypothetical protein PF011_g594 [Phytophthora fragariae]KAE9140486.1 hypothetical protein PF010_g167 [Phytophthora fragariae]KAE9141514.1 hypothetical protein PF007_g172 [Phytophthora fragariae]
MAGGPPPGQAVLRQRIAGISESERKCLAPKQTMANVTREAGSMTATHVACSRKLNRAKDTD